jgi:hypothetical protein
MKFVDEAIIDVLAGNGGDGAASFRREKYIPRGGPDGGDGGRGGNIHAVADRNINTLVDFRFARTHRAGHGERGMGSDCYGAAGKDITLRMPVGTIITDVETDEKLAELMVPGERVLIAKGGDGGFGDGGGNDAGCLGIDAVGLGNGGAATVDIDENSGACIDGGSVDRGIDRSSSAGESAYSCSTNIDGSFAIEGIESSCINGRISNRDCVGVIGAVI